MKKGKHRWLVALLVVPILVLGFVIVSQRLDWWDSVPQQMLEPWTFSDGFEDADTLTDLCPLDGRRWHGFQQEPRNDPSRCVVELSSERVHSGKKSLKCFAGPKDRGLVKADVQHGGLPFTKGDRVWFRGWFYLEDGGNAAHVFFWDLEASRKYGSPGRRLYLQSDECLASDLGKWEPPGGPTFRPAKESRIPFPKGRWVELKISLLLSERADGEMKVWQDGTPILDGHGETLPTAKAVYDRLQVGITANGNDTNAHTVYIDDVTISNRQID